MRIELNNTVASTQNGKFSKVQRIFFSIYNFSDTFQKCLPYYKTLVVLFLRNSPDTF